MAGRVWPGFPIAVSAGRIRDSDGLAERRAGAVKEATHPLAFARWLARFGSDGLAGSFGVGFRRRPAGEDFQISILQPDHGLATAARLHTHRRATHPRPDLAGGDLIKFALVANGVVAGDHAVIDRTENCLQRISLA